MAERSTKTPAPNDTSSLKGITFGNRVFSPGLVPTIVTLLTLCLLINLGFWQLRRAHFKEATITRLEQRSAMATTSLSELGQYDGDLNDYPVRVQGHYLEGFNLYLDNRIHNTIAGYHLLTPFLTDGKVLLVNRGWLPRGPDRNVLPTVPAVSGQIQLEGLAHVPNPKNFVLKEDDYQNVSWPFLIQKIDLEKTAPLFDYPMVPFVLRLSPDPDSNLTRQWQSNFMGPDKHYGYAFQWFSLAAALTVIYLVVNTHANNNNKKSSIPNE